MMKALIILATILFALIALAFMGLEIYVWVKFANSTIVDTPNWARFFMGRHL